MKSRNYLITFSLIAILLSANEANAQWWSLTGNAGTTPGTNFLGTTDPKALYIKTNNTTRLVISSAGKVGIGITSPTYKLDVNADARFNSVRVGRGNNSIPENTAIGDSTLSYNTTGVDNTACGHLALKKNTIGGDNSAFGSLALSNNISGEGNVATGGNSLRENTTGIYNTASGAYALTWNTTGELNTACGNSALIANRTGNNNTATGGYALNDNYDGSYNTATGYEALYKNVAGTGNTAIGYESLFNFIPGINNTGLGTYADITAANFSNATAIGYNAKANSSNKIRLGNASVTVIEGQVAYTFPSDARFKYNIKNNIPGLDFIMQLKPVTYNFDTKKFEEHLMQNTPENIKEERMKGEDFTLSSNIVHSGFLAQDIEKICKQLGYDFDGLHVPDVNNNTDNYSLAYSQFIMPLVKSVQELSKQNGEQQKQIEAKDAKVSELQNQLTEMQQCVQSLCDNSSLKSSSSSVATESKLMQNQPNPFNQSTIIRYTLSAEHSSGNIVMRDLSGNMIKSIAVSNTGKGQVTINANELAQGTYTYTLEIAGESIDTKLMVIVK